jgi:hypothetical protein
MDESDPSRFSFRPREGLSGDALIQAAQKLSRYAGRLGFVLETPLDTVTSDEELDNHYQETYPPSTRESFIAKEHFWKIGEELGMDKRASGAVFTRLVYPMRAKSAIWQAEDIVDPIGRVGLVIRSRKEVGMPLPPPGINLKGGGTTKSQYMHKEKKNGTKLPPQDVVIQVGSLIELSENPEILMSSVTFPSAELRNFALIGLRLKDLVGEA